MFMGFRKAFVILLAIFIAASCKQNVVPYRTALLGEMRKNFDPAAANDESEFTLLAQICARLTSVDDSVNIVGDLAEKWAISTDRKTYIFHLSSKHHFSDGQVVTADDVQFSLERAKTKRASMAATWLPEIQEMRVLGPFELQIVLAQGNPRFLYTLSHPGMCVLKRSKPLLVVNGFQFPNSAGAYRVRDASPGKVGLEVSPDFAQKAVESKIDVRFLPQKSAVESFRNGELEDLSFYFLGDEELRRLAPQAKSLKTQIFWTWTIMLNAKHAPFLTRNARLELIRSFNSDRFRSLWGADVIASSSLVPHGMRGFRHPKLSTKSARVSLNCSRPLSVSVIDGIPLKDRLKRALESELENASGCKVEIHFLEMGKWVEDFASAGSDLYFCGLDPNSLDPLGYYRFFISGASDDYLGYDDSALTNRFRQLYRKLPVERSNEEYQSLQSTFEDAGFGIPVGSPTVTFLYGRNVSQIHVNPIGMLLNRWWEIGREKGGE